MSEKPFYLKGTGNNLLTDEIITLFKRENPKLADKLDIYPIELRTLDLSHLESFIAWILSQQISGKVAETLLNRFRELVNPITPENILQIADKDYREIGLSRSKVQYIRNIALFYNDNKELGDHSDYSSREILNHYTQIKGIGPWTVNMFLIFNLGRLDIAAPKDLVVRKGMKVLYHLDAVPTEKEAMQLMRDWGDLGTVGTVLSWAAMGE